MKDNLFKYIRTANYYETDQMGIVHHSNYVRWFEEARLAYLESIGLAYDTVEASGVLIPVISVECTYRQPVHYNETVEILVWMKKFNGVKLVIDYRIVSPETGNTLTTGETGHCFLDKAMSPLILQKACPKLYEQLYTEKLREVEE